MARKDIVDALDLAITRHDRKKKNTERGRVVAVNDDTALVRVGGSQIAQSAIIPSGLTVKSGDLCILKRNKVRSRMLWIIDDIIDQANVDQKEENLTYSPELFPPINVRADDIVPGAITILWNVPVKSPISFEVQTSPDGLEATATTELITRGSYAIIPTDSPLYFRVRSINFNGQKSAWTAWVQAEPYDTAGAGAGLSGYTETGFSYSDTSIDLLTVEQDTNIREVHVIIDTPFDGVTTLEIGEPGNPDRFLEADEADLTQAGHHINFPYYKYNQETTIQAIVNNTSSASGSGRIFLIT